MLVTPSAHAPSRRRRLLAAFLSAGAVLGAGLVSAAPAQAATLGQSVVVEASHHVGQPYVYGAAGPTRFDCSGFTQYVFGRFGRHLPRTTSSQYSWAYMHHISASSKALGDLIFMRDSSGAISHVGIYAGSNTWWVAPHTGAYVKRQTLYSTNYSVGRVY